MIKPKYFTDKEPEILRRKINGDKEQGIEYEDCNGGFIKMWSPQGVKIKVINVHNEQQNTDNRD